MKITLPLIAVVFFLTDALAQNIVPPPPSQPSTAAGQKIFPPSPSRPIVGTRVTPPQAFTIRFRNGAKVEIHRDKFVVLDSARQHMDIKRPLRDLARPPSGCDRLHNYLDTTDCHTNNWRDSLEVYLSRCLNLK